MTLFVDEVYRRQIGGSSLRAFKTKISLKYSLNVKGVTNKAMAAVKKF